MEIYETLYIQTSQFGNVMRVWTEWSYIYNNTEVGVSYNQDGSSTRYKLIRREQI